MAANQTFEDLILPLRPVLMQGALKMTGKKEDAQDLVQETCLRTLRSFDSFEQGSNCKAWLLRIMRNAHFNNHRQEKMFNRLRSKANRRWVNTRILSQETMRSLKGIENNVTRRMTAKKILLALNGLPEKYRIICTMADFQGFSYRKISRALGCPVGTVMSRLHRARQMLSENKDLNTWYNELSHESVDDIARM